MGVGAATDKRTRFDAATRALVRHGGPAVLTVGVATGADPWRRHERAARRGHGGLGAAEGAGRGPTRPGGWRACVARWRVHVGTLALVGRPGHWGGVWGPSCGGTSPGGWRSGGPGWCRDRVIRWGASSGVRVGERARSQHGGQNRRIDGTRSTVQPADLLKYCAPGRIRTCGRRIRSPMLFPLSYRCLVQLWCGSAVRNDIVTCVLARCVAWRVTALLWLTGAAGGRWGLGQRAGLGAVTF